MMRSIFSRISRRLTLDAVSTGFWAGLAATLTLVNLAALGYIFVAGSPLWLRSGPSGDGQALAVADKALDQVRELSDRVRASEEQLRRVASDQAELKPQLLQVSTQLIKQQENHSSLATRVLSVEGQPGLKLTDSGISQRIQLAVQEVKNQLATLDQGIGTRIDSRLQSLSRLALTSAGQQQALLTTSSEGGYLRVYNKNQKEVVGSGVTTSGHGQVDISSSNAISKAQLDINNAGKRGQLTLFRESGPQNNVFFYAGESSEQNPLLMMRDDANRPLITVHSSKNERYLHLYNPREATAASLSVSAEGAGELYIRDNDGKLQGSLVSLTSGKRGILQLYRDSDSYFYVGESTGDKKPFVQLSDDNKKRAFTFNAADDRALSLFNKNERVVVNLRSSNNGGSIYLATNSDVDKSAVNLFNSSSVEGGGVIQLMSKDGRGQVSIEAVNDGVGTVFLEGPGNKKTVLRAGGADLAEAVRAAPGVHLRPGEAVEVVGSDAVGPLVAPVRVPNSMRVLGIVSGAGGLYPALVLHSSGQDGEHPIALGGTVFARVTGACGPVSIGDLLVSSGQPGVLCKAADEAPAGAVVARAIEPLSNGDGLARVWVGGR